MEIDRTRYATELAEQETGKEFWISGRFIGTKIIPEGQRPFPDREAAYDVVEIHKNKRTADADEAVFTAASSDERSEEHDSAN